MVRFNIDITQEQYDHLTRLKKSTGLSIAAHIRWMIEDDIYKAKKQQVSGSASPRKDSNGNDTRA